MQSKVSVQISIKEREVKELLKLQELFHSQYMTQELLNAMIGLYVKFVENIQLNQHPLRLFFMEKIKFVLSRPQVIRILEKDSIQNNRNMRDTIRQVVGMSYDQQLQMRRMAQETKREVRQNHVINIKKNEGERNDAMKQKQRNIKIEMQMKIMEEVETNMRLLKKDLSNQGETRKKKEQEISKIVQQQDNTLNQRLAKRKKRLRKKSADLHEKQTVVVEAAPPIAKEELLEMKKIVTATFQRFTRLTQNMTKRDTQRTKEAEGRVKVKVQQNPIEDEDVFDTLAPKEKSVQSQSFSKKKKVSEEARAQPKRQSARKGEQKQEKGGREVDSSVEFKPFDRKTGRVTARIKEYEQIEQDDCF